MSVPIGSCSSPITPLILSVQCTNFTCCGLHLSDLHSMLEHFEEAHVTVIDGAGNTVFPRTRPPSDGFDTFHLSVDNEYLSEHPYTSVVYGYPQEPMDAHDQYQHQPQRHHESEPVSPLEVESPTPSAYYARHTFLDPYHFDEGHDILSDLDAFTSVAETHNISNSQSPKQPVALPPASFKFVADAPCHRVDRPSHEHRHREDYKARILNAKPRPYQRRRDKAHKC